MGSIFETLARFFEEEVWTVSQLKNEPVLSMAVSGQNGTWHCFATAREEQYQCVFYSICETLVPEDRRIAAAEYITRANSGMAIGNFEMNFNDGEVRYKTSIDVEGDRLNTALVRNLVYANVMMMDRYLPGLIAVTEGIATPHEAIQAVEAQSAQAG
jgi:hypothetical protein